MQPERVVLSLEELTSAVGDRWSAAEVTKVAGLLEDGEGQFPPGTRPFPPTLSGPSSASGCSPRCCGRSPAARVLIVEARAASPAGLRRRDQLLERFTACIDAQLRDELPEHPAPIAAAGVVGGIEAVLYARVNAGEFDELPSLLPSLMYFAVLPFRGQPTAEEGAG